MDVEDMLFREKKKEEEKERIRSRLITIIEKANRLRYDNLTEKERKGMRCLKERENIVIQPADKGGAITVMSKEWYKNKMKEQITEDCEILDNNNKKRETR